ncbi:5-formyltetrahydrofolate cyclo-ligase [Bosea sp. (in: a-proteobacteria)]|uniref:5-formyltetrahydrofolate cyclo-ligase n=1 Tax=Bosea sp. (in: a-proteobacteria) TaxID=1871050 RepID=UPI002604026E|nr:5-formyltetrahydrofolate cyclo-ligase [Bosea sp. (in: a-proteobacteria)]MCO5091522.1 5-formyltetrahydrofolate cyclo-ligase [Bosea sp. (in: a-proteobacteria)]
MTTTPAPDKAMLRAGALARRDALDRDSRLAWDRDIAARVLALPVWAGAAGPVSAYWPMRSEADPRPILEALDGLPLCLPAITGGRMVFRRWAPGRPLVPGGFGTSVPAHDEPELAPAILIVPLAAFDRRGYRIGYGRGYYDRALTELGPTLSIGIGYAAQEVDAVPEEPHDRPLDWIATEREAIPCG